MVPPGVSDKEEERHSRNIEQLTKEYGGKIRADEISRIYHEKRARYSDATVKDYVEIFVVREVKETLATLINHCTHE